MFPFISVLPSFLQHNISYPLIRTRTCACQGVRSVCYRILVRIGINGNISEDWVKRFSLLLVPRLSTAFILEEGASCIF